MGRQKLLLDYGGKSVVRHIVDELTASVVDEVYVVVGHEGKRVAADVSGAKVTVVANDQYDMGMLSSVRCGLGAVDDNCKAVLVALGDQPSIRSGIVDEIVRAYGDTDKGIVVPTYRGRRGHPVMVSTRYKDEIMTHYDGVGLRGLLREHDGEVFELEVSSPSVCSDMNEPGDYQRQLDFLER